MWAVLQEPCDDNVIRSGPAAAPCSKASGRWILAATILASSMAFIDGTVVNVALPALQINLNATAADVQWVIESFRASSFGIITRRWLVRRSLRPPSCVFARCCDLRRRLGPLRLCRQHSSIDRGASPSGFGAALLVPGSLAIISNSFSEQERGRAIGVWSGFSAITTGIGPVFGGWLIEHVSWRAVFFINVPLAFVVVLISLRHVAETQTGKAVASTG